MMNALKVPSHFTSICKEIYANSTQRVRSSDGLTDENRITQGIKQGCPLSPRLFNLVLEGILPHIERMDGGYEFGNGTKVQILAYADDICVTGRSKEDINNMSKQIQSGWPSFHSSWRLWVVGGSKQSIKGIGHLQGQSASTPPSLATRHLFHRLAICLWRDNATLWIGRLPIHSPEVDGVQ